MSTNPWNMVYKLASGKINSCCTLSTLRSSDGNVTSDMAETINVMMEHFTPADDEEKDNDYHKLIRVQKTIKVTTEDYKQFTTAEILDSIHEMSRNKAPGEDGITREVVERACNLLP